MTFKVGDKVRYKKADEYREMQGWEGKVIEDSRPSGNTRVEATAVGPKAGYRRVGDRGFFTTANLELIEKKEEAKVTELKYEAGDKIVFVEPHAGQAEVGDTAVVLSTYTTNSGAYTYIDYKLDKDGRTGDCFPQRVKKIEKPFTYGDIQKGDTIRRTKVYKSGAKEIREGVVGKKGYDYWPDTNNKFILVYESDKHSEAVTLELLDRPKAPELWENRKAGDKIASYTLDGKFDRVFTKREDGLWDTLLMNTMGKLQKGFERSDKDIEAQLNGREAHLVKT